MDGIWPQSLADPTGDRSFLRVFSLARFTRILKKSTLCRAGCSSMQPSSRPSTSASPPQPPAVVNDFSVLGGAFGWKIFSSYLQPSSSPTCLSCSVVVIDGLHRSIWTYFVRGCDRRCASPSRYTCSWPRRDVLSDGSNSSDVTYTGSGASSNPAKKRRERYHLHR
jgi:hypothetical protein